MKKIFIFLAVIAILYGGGVFMRKMIMNPELFSSK